MVYVVALQELSKLIRCKGETIISVDKAGQSILGDEHLQAVGQVIGRLGYISGQEGVFAEEISDEQVLLAFMGDGIGCNLLPWAIGDVSQKHQLCRGETLCLEQIVHQQTYLLCWHQCWPCVVPLLPVPAPSPSPGGLCAGQ